MFESCFLFRFNSSAPPAESMPSSLLEEIRGVNIHAAKVLEEAALHTDRQILTLTREDLRDLFPKNEDFQLRRTLFETIHKQPMAEQLLERLKGFIPHDFLRAGLANNGVLVEYLQMLKDMKTQMNVQMSFINAHIGLLEEFSADQPDGLQIDGRSQEAAELSSGPSASATGGPVELAGGQSGGQSKRARAERSSGPSASATGGPVELPSGQNGDNSKRARDVGHQKKQPAGPTQGHAQEAHEPFTILSTPDFVKRNLPYKMVIGGITFDYHLNVMEQVKKQVQKCIRLCEDKQDYDLTFVFCPISSRIAVDVVAALANIKDDKPIILVLMHHTREVKPVTSMRTWSDDAKVVLRVNVFFHETCGLLKCEQNDIAVNEMRYKLMEMTSFPEDINESKDTSGKSFKLNIPSIPFLKYFPGGAKS